MNRESLARCTAPVNCRLESPAAWFSQTGCIQKIVDSDSSSFLPPSAYGDVPFILSSRNLVNSKRMRTLITFVVINFVVPGLFAQSLKPEQVPAVVVRGLHEKFPNTKSATWKLKTDG